MRLVTIAIFSMLFVTFLFASAQADITSGIQAYYPFNGNANDESGNGYDGSVTGATLASDRFGNSNAAYSFDGNQDYISIPYTNTPSSITIAMWVNLHQQPGSTVDRHFPLVGIYENNDGAYGISYSYLYGEYRVRPHIWSSTAWQIDEVPYTLSTGAWHHIVMTYDSSSRDMKVYVDGSLISTMQNVSPPSGDHPTAGTEASIGRGYSEDPIWTNGDIDDVRIYDRALSQSDVIELYNEADENSAPDPDITNDLEAYYPFNGNANDESGNGYDGSVTGATLTSDRFGNSNAAYSFDGNQDYISIPYTNTPSSITIAMWVNLHQQPGSTVDRHFPLVGIYENNDGAYGISYSYLYGEYRVRPHIWSSTAWQIDEVPYTLSTGAWHHIVMTYDSSSRDMKVYVDGSLKSTMQNVSPPSGDHPTAGTEASIGRGYSEDPIWTNGDIDDVRIYDRALSATDITALYNEKDSSDENDDGDDGGCISSSYNYYLPLYTNKDGYWSGFALSNKGTSTASICYEVLSSSGSVVHSGSTSIPSSGQTTVVPEVQATMEGWINIFSNNQLTGLSFIGSSLMPNYMADVPFSDSVSSYLELPHVAQNSYWTTTIYISNPNSSSSTVSIFYVNSNGQSNTATTKSIASKGSISVALDELDGALSQVGGTVSITATQGVVAFGLYSNLKAGGHCFTGINAVDLDGNGGGTNPF